MKLYLMPLAIEKKTAQKVNCYWHIQIGGICSPHQLPKPICHHILNDHLTLSKKDNTVYQHAWCCTDICDCEKKNKVIPEFQVWMHGNHVYDTIPTTIPPTILVSSYQLDIVYTIKNFVKW